MDGCITKVKCKGVFINTRTCYHDVGISYIEFHMKVTGSYLFFLSVSPIFVFCPYEKISIKLSRISENVFELESWSSDQ